LPMETSKTNINSSSAIYSASASLRPSMNALNALPPRESAAAEINERNNHISPNMQLSRVSK